MDVQYYYGPRDDHLLYNQTKHRSKHIQDDNIDDILAVRRGDAPIWELYMHEGIHEVVIRQLHRMGFLGVLRCGRLKYDCHLITALIERWRSETHTFHFRDGEATITLQDITMIWGLPIQGEPIIGSDNQKDLNYWVEECNSCLGFRPAPNHFRTSGQIKVSAIRDFLLSNPVNENSPQIRIEQYSRAVAFMIFGYIICPDSTGNAIPLLYLQYFRDLDEVQSYSWGSATLATLYREMCTATEFTKKFISGPLALLQIWAWSRIKPVMPTCIGDPDMSPLFIDEVPVYPPYGARWKTSKSYVASGKNMLRLFRQMLDVMTPNQFVWQPYSMEFPEVSALSADARDSILWRAQCPLICYARVEMHRADRVCRQFGMLQNIPDDPMDKAVDIALHSYDRTGHLNKDWKAFHAEYVKQWSEVCREEIDDGPSVSDNPQKGTGYEFWYNNITRRLISPLHKVEDTGFQSANATLMDIVVDQLRSIGSSNQCRNRDDNLVLNELLDKYLTLGHAVVEAYEERQFTQQMPHISPEERQPPMPPIDQSVGQNREEMTNYPSVSDRGMSSSIFWTSGSRLNENLQRVTDIPEDAILLTPYDESAHTQPGGIRDLPGHSTFRTPLVPYDEGPSGSGDYAYNAAYAPTRRHFRNTPIPFGTSPVVEPSDDDVSHPISEEAGEGHRLGRGRRNIRRRGCGTHDYYFPF